MNVMILKDNEEFSKLTSNIIAKQHFIAYGEGKGYFRVAKDRQGSMMCGSRISEKTLHWHFLKKSEKSL